MRSLSLILAILLLVPAAVGLEVDHTPVERAVVGKPIPVDVGIESAVPVERVDVVPSYNYGWSAFTLNLTVGTNTHGRWYGEIPPLDKIGTLYYQIDIRFENGTNKVREYHVDIYTTEEVSGGWLDMPSNPWVLGIGALFLVGSMVILEVLFRRRLFRRKKASEEKGSGRRARKIKKR